MMNNIYDFIGNTLRNVLCLCYHMPRYTNKFFLSQTRRFRYILLALKINKLSFPPTLNLFIEVVSIRSGSSFFGVKFASLWLTTSIQPNSGYEKTMMNDMKQNQNFSFVCGFGGGANEKNFCSVIFHRTQESDEKSFICRRSRLGWNIFWDIFTKNYGRIRNDIYGASRKDENCIKNFRKNSFVVKGKMSSSLGKENLLEPIQQRAVLEIIFFHNKRTRLE